MRQTLRTPDSPFTPAGPLHSTRSCLALTAACLLLHAPDARAQSVELRSLTLGQLTQRTRSDLRQAPQQLFTQGLMLSGHDLLGDRTGSLGAHLRFRYSSDLALQPPLAGTPSLRLMDNALMLDLAYVDYKPLPWLSGRLGRHWSWGALGTRDLDGLTLRLAGTGELVPFVEGSFGRDVQVAQGWLAPDTFDVQGLPATNDSRLPSALHAQARAGLGWGERLRVEGAALRRQTSAQYGRAATVEESRVGGALVVQPLDSLVLTAAGSWHMLLNAADRAQLQLAWRAPWAGITASAGVERRRPWFNASSIFNLFGLTPHDSAHLTLALPVEPLDTGFELRVWGRAFHADADTADLGAGPDDARAAGAALAHDTRLAGRWRWRSQASVQLGPDDYGGDQYLLDTQLRVPGWIEQLSFTGRLLGIMAVTSHHRIGDELGLSATLGADIPVLDHGTLGVFIEHRVSSNLPALTSASAALTLEVWP